MTSNYVAGEVACIARGRAAANGAEATGPWHAYCRDRGTHIAAAVARILPRPWHAYCRDRGTHIAAAVAPTAALAASKTVPGNVGNATTNSACRAANPGVCLSQPGRHHCRRSRTRSCRARYVRRQVRTLRRSPAPPVQRLRGWRRGWNIPTRASVTGTSRWRDAARPRCKSYFTSIDPMRGTGGPLASTIASGGSRVAGSNAAA
jgi:hypothetical protein